MELQKQPVMATKEQLRLAELTQTGSDVTIAHDDIALKRVKKVIELTRCTQSQAEVALIDSEGNVEDAVARLLDNPEKLVLWSQQGKTKKAKTATGSAAAAPSAAAMMANSTNNNAKSAARNGPPQQHGRRAYSQTKNQRLLPNSSTRDGPSNFGRRPLHSLAKNHYPSRPDAAQCADEEEHREQGIEKNDEWKNGPLVFMPSSAAATASASASAAASVVPDATTAPVAQQKPKTFAAVAGAKKAKAPTPPPPLPQPQQTQAATVAPESQGTEPNWTSESWAPTEGWTPPPPSHAQQPQQPAPQPTQTTATVALDAHAQEPEQNWTSEGWAPSTEGWTLKNWASSSAKLDTASLLNNNVDRTQEQMVIGGVTVNQEYTDQLKNAIGLVTTSSAKLDSVGMLNSNNVDRIQEKVEFVTGEAFPAPTSTSYQFGFHFNSSKHNDATWAHQPQQTQHISAVENSTGAMLNNGPTRQPGNALSFSDTASVNFPPSSGQPVVGGGGPAAVVHGNNSAAAAANFVAQQSGDPSAVPQQQHHSAAVAAAVHHQQPQLQQQPQQQNKATATTLFTPAAAVAATVANPAAMVSVPTAPQAHPSVMSMQQQHMQQQHHQQAAAAAAAAQTIFHHQTSAAPVPQFPNYNMPYMYSPVATAQTLTAGPNAEIDRFLIQQYGTPYSQLDLQMGAMSIGPPTTLAPNHHRATLESYMENKFGQQQQNVNQAANNGHYQQSQQNQQQRGLAQAEPATLLGGPPSHVGPPPGFGMPTAPTQPSYVQPANIHSLFQMPTYPHPYQHPQYMMSNANRFQTAQRPAQTSPPEAGGANVPPNQRRGGAGDAQGTYAGAGTVPDTATAEQHSAVGGVAQQQAQYGNNFNHKYRSYM